MPTLVSAGLRLTLGGLLLALGGPAFAGPDPAPVPMIQPPAAIVYVVDGCAGLPGPAGEMTNLAGPMQVEVVHWSHGTGRVFADMHGHAHHKACGRDLAAQVLARRDAFPNGRIVLVGHSAGAVIVLAAADCLPAGSVDRIILLAPAVASCYELGPALQASREGIDVFFSYRDLVSHSMWWCGTADGHFFSLTAGVVGFRPTPKCDPALYGNLRQYSGWHTGHFTCIGTDFLSEHILPLVQTGAPPDPTMPPAALTMPSNTGALAVSMVRSASYTPSTAPRPRPVPGRSGIAPISDGLRIP